MSSEKTETAKERIKRGSRRKVPLIIAAAGGFGLLANHVTADRVSDGSDPYYRRDIIGPVVVPNDIPSPSLDQAVIEQQAEDVRRLLSFGEVPTVNTFQLLNERIKKQTHDLEELVELRKEMTEKFPRVAGRANELAYPMAITDSSINR